MLEKSFNTKTTVLGTFKDLETIVDSLGKPEKLDNIFACQKWRQLCKLVVEFQNFIFLNLNYNSETLSRPCCPVGTRGDSERE